MAVICLTGGIASGKSTAARFLANQGAEVIDADKLGHEAYAPGNPANDQIVAHFGEEVRAPSGDIDRKALGGKVFGQPDQLKASPTLFGRKSAAWLKTESEAHWTKILHATSCSKLLSSSKRVGKILEMKSG